MHLARKKLVSKCFSPSHLTRFVEGVTQLSLQLNSLLSERAKDAPGNVVDVYHLLYVSSLTGRIANVY